MPETSSGLSPAWQINEEDVDGWVPPPFPCDVCETAINFAWLLDSKNRGKTVPVRQVASEHGERYIDNCVDIVEVEEGGDRVKIQGAGFVKWVQAVDVRPFRPMRITMTGPTMQVTPLDSLNEHFGKIFNVIWDGYTRMFIRERGQTKATKSKPDLEVMVDDWVVVMTK